VIYFKYLTYLLRHKWFVLVASYRIGAPIWNAIFHDFSKFYPSEFIPYAQYFYWNQAQNDRETMQAFCLYSICEAAPYGHFVSDRFSIAWNYHQKRNKHHWQYWVLLNDDGTVSPMPMPKRYVLEMVADWMGAGRAINGRWEVKEWYEKNKNKMNLRMETRNKVEEILNAHA